MPVCSNCRVELGHKPRGEGYHTAAVVRCPRCGNIRGILPDRHFIIEEGMKDISGSVIKVGEEVYALTTPTSGSKYKRLFHAIVTDISDNHKKCRVRCTENDRVVSLQSQSLIKAFSHVRPYLSQQKE